MSVRATRVLATIAFAALSAAPLAASAQLACKPQTSTSFASTADWPAPLGRLVRVDVRDLSLRDALTRVAADAGVRLSWSAEALPLDRRVCAHRDSVPLGEALLELLDGVPVEPVAAAADHVVLTPARTRRISSPQLPSEKPVQLEPLLIHADPVGFTHEQQPWSVDVLEGTQLAARSEQTLSQAINAAVPGIWLWESSTSGVLAQYGSIRGASSFGSSAPKIYIDGIQVANPLLLTRLSTDAIERVEIIRGPQGAALYGADAISGVMNIVTRTDAGAQGAERVALRSAIGMSATEFSPGSAVAWDHALHLNMGSHARTASVDVTLGTSGEPAGAFSRHFGIGGAARFVGERSLVTGTLRYESQRAAASTMPLVSRSFSPAARVVSLLGDGARSVDHLTLGVRASVQPGARWTHTFVAGVDGYGLDGTDAALPGLLSPVDAALRDAGTGAIRGTLRITSAAALDLGSLAEGTFTTSLEHSLLHQKHVLESPDATTAGGGLFGSLVTKNSRNNTGVSAQLEVALVDQLFLTGGLRLEHTDAVAGINGVATLPALGAAWIGEVQGMRIKLRGGYGKGMRWPELNLRQLDWSSTPLVFVPLDLGPEQQAGIEAGADIFLGSDFSLRFTRFDQTASGLVQRVLMTSPQAPGSTQPPLLAHAYQNVGEIDNRGWEMQASARRGPLTVDAALSFVDSRVRRLARDYDGDLQPGDRMLAVPARTASINAAWVADAWSVNVTAARAMDWVNYDRLAMADALARDGLDAGPGLRSWWTDYEGITHLRALLTRDLRNGLLLTVSGENLLDNQTGEPDNISVLRGRTISVGLRATF